ncbi:UNVERIFIED_CONTAM: hypothetical protein RMT77_012259 [Armadillidium vulgare]|nr:Golgi apparatus membrane protein TVP23-like protein B [Armadillidium vulgare]
MSVKMDNDTLAFGEENEPVKTLRHPLVTFLHVVFRALSVIIYLFCGAYGSGFIGSFVIIVLLLSMDFWVVKNVTGRLMVGLRWWNYIDEDGKSHWVFEARKGERQGRISTVESQIFWTALVVAPILWVLLFLVAIIRVNFRWMMIILIALTLSGSNLYGYVMCKIGKSEGITGSVKNFFTGLFQRQMVNSMTSYFSKSPPASYPSSTV